MRLRDFLQAFAIIGSGFTVLYALLFIVGAPVAGLTNPNPPPPPTPTLPCTCDEAKQDFSWNPYSTNTLEGMKEDCGFVTWLSDECCQAGLACKGLADTETYILFVMPNAPYKDTHAENGSTHNNGADAYKHAVAHCCISCSADPECSKKLGDANELRTDYPGESECDEIYMDLYNNQHGKNIGTEVKNDPTTTCWNGCKQEILTALLNEEFIVFDTANSPNSSEDTVPHHENDPHDEGWTLNPDGGNGPACP